ncbi:MAG: 5-formyltetrahydrofolate cyclo-ligase [Cypionkella sp.]
MATHKLIRQRIWERRAAVARPDTRFHMNFAEFIPDFVDSVLATDRICALPAFGASQFAFITPDNSMVDLRRRMIEAGKPFVMSSFRIHRGFLLLDPANVPPGAAQYAAWMDGMEHFAKPITLEDIARLGRFDLMVTGASAVSTDGVRFGKGHGYFDLEWGMFSDLGVADENTLVVAAVHDVGVVEDKLHPSETDILADLIATPTRLIDTHRRIRRPRGIKWDLLSTDQIAAMPPLAELAHLRGIV